LKWQVLADYQGHIIHVSGPFSSLDNGHIWNHTYVSLGLWIGSDSTNPEHQNRYEVYIGDIHYMKCRQCVVPIRKESGEPLAPLEFQYNNFLGSVRSMVEQAFGYLKTWQIIGGVYRGMLFGDTGYQFLTSAFRLCCELYNDRFTILGHKKRSIRVLSRDRNGNPTFTPPNFTTENYRLRVNLHYQLSTYHIVSNFFYGREYASTFKTKQGMNIHRIQTRLFERNNSGCHEQFILNSFNK
jgi:hypothetical protein